MTGTATRTLVGTGLAWGSLWLATMMLIGATIAVLSPESIDPGEGPLMFLAVFGPMGLLTGLVFAALLLAKHGADAPAAPTLARTLVCGVSGTAIVQLAYLGHGDQGLAANAGMALMFSAIGGAVSVVWLALARLATRRRSSGPAST